MSVPPLIGITAGASADNPGHYQLRWDYVHALAEVEAVPVILTPGKAAKHPGFLDRFRALVLSGGGDVDPRHYGQEPHPEIRDVSEERDELELDLAARALECGMPLLGICRGMQLINVALGGSLIQDLPSAIGEEIRHDDAERSREVLVHQVRFDPASSLRRTFGQDELDVNSFHHQAIDRLGDGLTPVGWSEDEVIEAVEGEGDSFLIGVQWHPESLWRRGAPYLALFEALCEAARNGRGV